MRSCRCHSGESSNVSIYALKEIVLVPLKNFGANFYCKLMGSSPYTIHQNPMDGHGEATHWCEKQTPSVDDQSKGLISLTKPLGISAQDFNSFDHTQTTKRGTWSLYIVTLSPKVLIPFRNQIRNHHGTRNFHIVSQQSTDESTRKEGSRAGAILKCEKDKSFRVERKAHAFHPQSSETSFLSSIRGQERIQKQKEETERATELVAAEGWPTLCLSSREENFFSRRTGQCIDTHFTEDTFCLEPLKPNLEKLSSTQEQGSIQERKPATQWSTVPATTCSTLHPRNANFTT